MCILIYQYCGPLALVLGFDVFVGGGSSSSSWDVNVNCRTISFNLRRKISLIFSILYSNVYLYFICLFILMHGTWLWPPRCGGQQQLYIASIYFDN